MTKAWRVVREWLWWYGPVIKSWFVVLFHLLPVVFFGVWLPIKRGLEIEQQRAYIARKKHVEKLRLPIMGPGY